MKYTKKLLAAVMVMVMALALGSSLAFAAGNGSITINNAVSGHTYTAYQIFKGDYADGVLSNIDWGTGITDDGKTALQTKYSKTDPADIAGLLSVEADAVAFADAVGANVTGGTAGSLSGTTYTIPALEDGYYMVVDTYTPAAEEENVTYSRYMIQVVGNAEVNNKAETPEVDKKIVQGQAKVEGNTANIGDEVTYEITSAVPDTTGYKEYYMDFSDTLSKGLTYKADSLTVKIGETTLTLGEGYTATIGAYSATDGTSIAIHLKDLVSRNYTQGAAITITYTATVNDNAVIGNTGNPNTVKLDYSNKPSDSGNGTPDDGNDGVQGETPQQEVKTYVTEIELTKVDAETKTALANAVFNVKGTQINKVIITGDHFVAAANGEYYLLTDNTYTKTAPNDQTKSKYATDDGGAYKRFNKEAYAEESQQEAANVDFQVVSDANGKIKVTGLKEGTYTFTEIQAPAGYNLLTGPITIEVKSNIAEVVADPTKTFEWQKATGATNVTVENGVFKTTVENNKGTELPSTGGMGTTILYVAGGIMVLLAGVYLITKRRASKEEEL